MELRLLETNCQRWVNVFHVLETCLSNFFQDFEVVIKPDEMETDVDPKQEAAKLDDVREEDLISAGEVTDTTPAKANEESIEEAEAPPTATSSIIDVDETLKVH